MTQLLGPNGRPFTVSHFTKGSKPPLGPAFENYFPWDASSSRGSGSALLQFDLNQLTLADFRAMRSHPQINLSLTLLTFIVHQADWKIECKDKAITEQLTTNIGRIWTRLVRAVSTAYWSGYAPSALEFVNDSGGRFVELDDIKDVAPELARVNWKAVESSYTDPHGLRRKVYTYNGINLSPSAHSNGSWSVLRSDGGYYSNVAQGGSPDPTIPAELSFWYTLLRTEGNFYGRRLLEAAFQPWYYSMLVHLWANRYYESFGAPLPVGRAPFDDDFTMADGKTMTGKQVMEDVVQSIRSRSSVVLPSDRDTSITGAGGTGAHPAYLYSIDYLESTARGADFEKYLSRLDEEMSLAIFTPMLLMRSGDVGSFNLGVQHAQTFYYILNALLGDLKEYVDRYIIKRLAEINWHKGSPPAEIVFRKLGKDSQETLRAIIANMITAGTGKVDVDDLSVALGMTVKEVKQVTAPLMDPLANPLDPKAPGAGSAGAEVRPGRARGQANTPKGVGSARATTKSIAARLQGQAINAFRDNTFGPDFHPSMGFRRKMTEALMIDGLEEHEATKATEQMYGRMENWLEVTVGLGPDEYGGPADWTAMVERKLDQEVDLVLADL